MSTYMLRLCNSLLRVVYHTKTGTGCFYRYLVPCFYLHFCWLSSGFHYRCYARSGCSALLQQNWKSLWWMVGLSIVNDSGYARNVIRLLPNFDGLSWQVSVLFLALRNAVDVADHDVEDLTTISSDFFPQIEPHRCRKGLYELIWSVACCSTGSVPLQFMYCIALPQRNSLKYHPLLLSVTWDMTEFQSTYSHFRRIYWHSR